VAEMLKKELGIDAELMEGKLGEFTVWVNQQRIAKKGFLRFPSDKKILSGVKAALA